MALDKHALIDPAIPQWATIELAMSDNSANLVFGRANVMLQTWGVFSLPSPDYLTTAAIENAISFYQRTLEDIPNTAERIAEEFFSTEAHPPEQDYPFFFPKDFTDSIRIKNLPYFYDYIIKELHRKAIDDGHRIEVTDSEYILSTYREVLLDLLYDEAAIFDVLSLARQKAFPPINVGDPHLNVSQLSKLIQFLMTPFEAAKELPKNIQDDIVTYFETSEQPNFEVSLPGWDEIITIFPDVEVTPEDKEAWTLWRKRAKSAGFGSLGFDTAKINAAQVVVGPAPLNFQQIEKMRKRWEIAKRINKSPTPDTLQTVGNILTWFDDIQDALVTLSYLGRVGIAAVNRISTRVAKKGIPVLGWVSAAKDMMDIFHYIRALRIARSNRKRNFWDSLELLPRSRAKSLRHFNKIKQLLPSWQESIQIAQTTDVLFETGLSLGGIVGVIEDIFFGLFTGATFKFLDYEFKMPRIINHDIAFIEVGILSPNLTPASLQAFRIINKASRILPHINQLPVPVVTNIFTALHYAWAFMAGSGDLRDWENWQHKTVDLVVRNRPLKWQTKEVLSALYGYHVRNVEPFGSPTYTIESTPRLLSKKITNKFAGELNVFMENHKHEDCSKYICSLINDITTNILIALNGPETEIEETLVPFTSALMLILHYDLDDKLPTDPDLQLSLVSEIADRVIHNFGKWPKLQDISPLFDLYASLE